VVCRQLGFSGALNSILQHTRMHVCTPSVPYTHSHILILTHQDMELIRTEYIVGVFAVYMNTRDCIIQHYVSPPQIRGGVCTLRGHISMKLR